MSLLDSLDSREVYNFFRKFYARHLVCLVAGYVHLDENNKPKENERHLVATGFVMSIDNHWFYVTAGHVFGDYIAPWLKSPKTVISNFGFKDNMGLNAVSPYPTMLPDFADIPWAWADDKTAALDVAAVYIRPFYRAGLEKNGIEPLYETHWGNDDFCHDLYCICGVPSELTTESVPSISITGNSITATIHPVLLNLVRSDPPHFESHETIPDWFFAKVEKPEDLKSIEGMSGGAIFGLQKTPEGDGLVSLVALQSRWRSKSQTAFGCRVKHFGPWVRAFKDKLAAEGKLVE